MGILSKLYRFESVQNFVRNAADFQCLLNYRANNSHLGTSSGRLPYTVHGFCFNGPCIGVVRLRIPLTVGHIVRPRNTRRCET